MLYRKYSKKKSFYIFYLYNIIYRSIIKYKLIYCNIVKRDFFDKYFMISLYVYFNF